MAQGDESGGVGALVRHTAGMAELAIHAGHPDRKYNEHLPYPDNHFQEPVDEHAQRDGKFIVTHVYDRDRRPFVPNAQVHVESIDAERTHVGFTEFLNPYLYCVNVEYGSYQWSIYRRYRHFHDLHKELVDFVEARTRRSINDFERNQDEMNDYPCFPTRNDRMAFITDSSVQERSQILAEYLNKVLKHPEFRAHVATRDFFDVSSVSFIYGLSVSQKEGYLLKRSHDPYRGQHSLVNLPFLCDVCKFQHAERWFVIKDSYILYIHRDTNEVRFPMLVDRAFNFSTGFRQVGIYHGIKIQNLQRTLVVKCRSKRDCDEWKQHLDRLMKQAKDFARNPTTRFSSYAPIREKQLAYWFINGKSYMEAVAKALLTAKEEVFITDWWLSPEIMMIRPSEDETFRLDNILGRIADAGVRVYVMIFKEMTIAVGLNSLYTKRMLQSKSQKGFIKVLRHPNHYVKGGVFLWSHHEKLVVIDQKIAFVGGIDLCYGRWDDEFMRLVDLGDTNDRNLKVPSKTSAEQAESDGVKIEGEAQKTTTTELPEQVDDHATKNVTSNPKTVQSMASVGSDHMATMFSNPKNSVDDVKAVGQTHASGTGHHMKSAAKKWIEAKLTGTDEDGSDSDSNRKNNDVSTFDRRAFEDDAAMYLRLEKHARRWRKLSQRIRPNDDIDSDEEEEIIKTNEPPIITDPSTVVHPKHRYFIGKDYSNVYQKDFDALNRYDEDYIDRKEVPRMPWHDEALVVFGAAARDVARHFIQRWNIHKCEKCLNNMSYPFLLPKSSTDEEDLIVRNWKDFLPGKPFKVDAQGVRSVGPWSAGTNTIESSVQNAYIQMIGAAQHFIYLENQFFITIAQDALVRNALGDTLFRRIEQAHRLNEKFRVYIVLPLLPGFDNTNAVQAVLYFIMRSITKDDTSLFKRLERAGISPDDYISIFGMRTHDILMGHLVSEIIYVHSKLMIIDDRMAICGSANINDRSLLGQRDSEFCMVINDREEEESSYNQQPVRIGKFCSSWRKRLFALLLGIQFENPNNIDVNDPVSDQFYNYIRDVARKNTLIYEEVFAVLPSDRVRKFSEINGFTNAPKLKDTDPIQAQEKLKGIQGLIVEYPLYFLDDEYYLPSIRSREGIVPNVTWT